MEVGRGLRGRKGSDGNMWATEHQSKREDKKTGVALREPGQEDGSQESQDDRGKVAIIEQDNLVGRMLALGNGRTLGD